jgi:hypothetical protein
MRFQQKRPVAVMKCLEAVFMDGVGPFEPSWSLLQRTNLLASQGANPDRDAAGGEDSSFALSNAHSRSASSSKDPSMDPCLPARTW